MVPITAGPVAAAAATAAVDSASAFTAGSGAGAAGFALVVVEGTAAAGGVAVMAASTIDDVGLGEGDDVLTTAVCEDDFGVAKASGGVTRSTDDEAADEGVVDDDSEGNVE